MLGTYNRRLRRRHPFVRVRWSDYRKCYVLEERVARSQPIDPDSYPESKVDVYIQARDGYATIEYLRALPSVTRLCDALNASRIAAEMQRRGVRDAAEWADQLTAADTSRAGREREKFRDDIGQVASEEYDRAQWRTGSRAAVPRGASS